MKNQSPSENADDLSPFDAFDLRVAKAAYEVDEIRCDLFDEEQEIADPLLREMSGALYRDKVALLRMPESTPDAEERIRDIEGHARVTRILVHDRRQKLDEQARRRAMRAARPPRPRPPRHIRRAPRTPRRAPSRTRAQAASAIAGAGDGEVPPPPQPERLPRALLHIEHARRALTWLRGASSTCATDWRAEVHRECADARRVLDELRELPLPPQIAARVEAMRHDADVLAVEADAVAWLRGAL